MRQDIFDKMLQDKLNEAREKGVIEGRQLALFEVAKNMAVNGYSMEQIFQVTGLTMADIKCVLD